MAATVAVPLPKSSPVASRELNHSFISGSPGLWFQVKPRRRKGRNELRLVVAAAASGGEAKGGGRFYFNFTGFPFPLGPFFNRRTLRYEVSTNYFLILLLDCTIH